MRTRLLIAFVTLYTATQSLAKVASIQFSNLVAGCDLIVVAKVDSVSSPLIGKKYATARVTEVWKGTNTATVEFLASPTWTCDISEAKKGETVLLFLTKSDKSRSYAIALSGRGRLPLRTVAGKSYATFWPEVILPKEIPTIDGPEPKWDFIRSVEVTTLRDLVTGAPQKNAIALVERTTSRHLTEAEVVHIAEAQAAKRGRNLKEYSQPSIRYSAKDKSWWVSYEMKPPTPVGGDFLVRVSDETREAQYFPGE